VRLGSALRRLVKLALAAVMLTLGGCGGGGGGGGSATVFGSLTYATNENVSLQGQLAATDANGATVTYTQVGNPTSGTVTSFSAAGAFTYKPNANFVGNDSFKVQATDSQGNVTPGTVMITVHMNQPPTATNLILRADGSALTKINVLGNAHDPDNDPLTVSIAEAPLVGSATVNADKTVSLTGLPGGFKGLTRFGFEVTDPSGASATATAAIFVGADPFRAVFAGDASGNGTPEVYLSDFAAAPVTLSAATQGNYRLKGFVASTNGATIAYRSEDSSTGTSALAFVQTATPAHPVSIAVPAGLAPVQNSQGNDQFQVSADGQWIAFIAGQGTTNSIYILNVTQPSQVSHVAPAGAQFMTQLSFSPDSKNLYFLATSEPGGANLSLYLVSLADPGATALISAASAPGSSDTVMQYSVSEDQSRILEEANRGGAVGLYYIDPQHLQVEVPVNQPLVLGESLAPGSFNSPPGIAVSANGQQVAYTVESLLLGVSTDLAQVSASPSPQQLASGGWAVAFRPDDAALLYTSGSQLFETALTSGASGQLVGSGSAGWYDSTGNIILLEQFIATGGTPPSYPVLVATVRGSFGTTQAVGSPVLAAQYFNVSGFDRAVVLLGEAPPTGPAPTSVHLSLVNALAPTKIFYPATFQTPLQLTTDVARVVTY